MTDKAASEISEVVFFYNIQELNMLLIFNTIKAETPRDYFDNTIAERITFGCNYKIIHLDDRLPDFAEFSHLLLTGSELSASQGSEWDQKIISVIAQFLKEDKAIYGICHGHQMIARTIAGDAVCQCAAEPEFGWKKMELKENSLFDNVTQPVFLESRYDEVYNVDDRFEVIAQNDREAVQAYQLKGKRVWGTQFHPEMLLEDGNKMIKNHLTDHPEERQFWANELAEGNEIEDNLNIFKNFLSS